MATLQHPDRLAAHAIVVFAVTSGGMFENLVARERRELAAQKDPW